MKLYKTEGIVLKRTNFKESDLILTIFTRDFGKISVIAKGARRPSSKFVGHLELFSDLKIMLVSGKNLDILSQTEVLRYFKGIRENLLKTGLAFYIAELIDKILAERQENYQIFELLRKTLFFLNKEKTPESLIYFFEVKLFELSGFGPEFLNCLICSSSIKNESNYFSFEGGFVCPKCAKKSRRKIKISREAVKLLRVLKKSNFELISKLKVKEEVLIEVRKILNLFSESIIEKKLKSKKFLKEVEKTNNLKDN